MTFLIYTQAIAIQPKMFKFLNQCFARLRFWKSVSSKTAVAPSRRFRESETLFQNQSHAKHWFKNLNILVSWHTFWQKKRETGNVGPLYIDHACPIQDLTSHFFAATLALHQASELGYQLQKQAYCFHLSKRLLYI